MFGFKNILTAQKTKILFLIIFSLVLSYNKVWSDNLTNSKEYLWEPQYYSKIEGEEKLLYTRSFSNSQLSFVDIDYDGDSDLFIGKSDGRIAFFINIGGISKPIFRLETEDYSVIHESVDEKGNSIQKKNIIDIGENASPTFVDIDNDEDFDLFIGSSDGHISYYENKGNKLKPIFFRKTPIYMGLKFGNNSAPLFADLNGDNNFDLVVGTGSGKINIFFNSGINEEAIFCPKFDSNNPPDIRCKFQPQILDNIAPQIDAVPEIVDWDNDKDFDIVVGKSNGKLNFYLNKGNRFSPKWELKSKNFQFINEGGNVYPTFHDLNGDSYPELFLGTSLSKVIFYENKEILFDKLKKIKNIKLEKNNPSATIEETLFSACKQLNGLPECLIKLASAFEVPESIKLNNLEEIIPYIFKTDASIISDENISISKNELSDSSKIKNIDSEEIFTRNRLWLNSQNFLNIEKLGGNLKNSSITSGDWNNDGRLDILIGSRSGEIFAFENRSEKYIDWYPVNFDALKKNNRSYSYPYLVDIDGDNDLDIICGNKQGKIEWIINKGTVKKPNWEIHNLNLSLIDVGSHSTPLLEDMDKDGDKDMLIGNSKGLIIYFENKGNKSLPRYVLRSTRFTGFQMKANSAPTFWNWNKDQYIDLVVGNREGVLNLITHLPKENSSLYNGWNLFDSRWENIKSFANSTPHFADFNNDNNTDLMIGDEQGNLFFWKNLGLKKFEKFKEDKTSVLTNNSLEVEKTTLVELDGIIKEEVNISNDVILENKPFKPKFEFVSNKFGDLELGSRPFPAFMDIDGDGNIDLVVGNKSGELRYYRQNKFMGNTSWSLEEVNFLDYKGGENSAPVFADLDGDNDLDLLVGNREGNIFYWENKGNFEIAEFVYNPTPFIGVTGGKNSVPSVLDLNYDGFNDLILGNLLGQLYKFERKNINKGFTFRLVRRKYLDIDVGLGAVPKIADIDKDNNLDLIVGSDSGRILNFKIKDTNSREILWERGPNYFENIKLPVGGNPTFVDIDEDGDLDMIIGSEEGTLYHFRNTGY